MALIAPYHYAISGNLPLESTPPYRDGAYPNGRPPAGAVSVAWDGVNGFGVAPNIVVHRNLLEKTLNSTFNITPTTGEAGTFYNDSTVGLPIIRELTPGGFRGFSAYEDGEAAQKKVAIIVPAHRRARRIITVGIPRGAYFPGNNTTAVETFPSDSGWKPQWVMNSNDGNTDNAKLDLCVPSHIGNGQFSVTGNATTMGSIGAGADNWAFSEVADGEFGNLNTWDLIHDCGTNSVTDAVPQTVYWTSPKISANKPTGTRTFNFTEPFAKNTGVGTVVNGVNDYVDYIKYNSYFLRSDTNPNKTDMLYCSMYTAIESSPGANDWRQGVFYCNAATWDACSLRVPVMPTTWSNTLVTVPAAPWWCTHVIVQNASGVFTVGAV